MKARYRLIRRGVRGGAFYCVDTETGKRTSLGTSDEDTAQQILQAKNNAERQPAINLQIAKAYIAGSDKGNESPKIVTRLDTTIDTKAEDRSLAREMIDLLKEQIRVKDGQLSDVGEQLKETHELNVKLTGTMLRQADEIRNLLRLTGGKTEMAEMATKERNIDNSGVKRRT